MNEILPTTFQQIEFLKTKELPTESYLVSRLRISSDTNQEFQSGREFALKVCSGIQQIEPTQCVDVFAGSAVRTQMPACELTLVYFKPKIGTCYGEQEHAETWLGSPTDADLAVCACDYTIRPLAAY